MSLAAKKGLSVQPITAVETEATAISESFEPAVEEPTSTRGMEPSSPPVPFPLLKDFKTYIPLSFPLRKPSDAPNVLTPLERQWIGVFRSSIPSFRDRAATDPSVEEAAKNADAFAERYSAMLDDFDKDPESHGGPPDILTLCRLRDLALRECGFQDIFKTVKDQENTQALQVLPHHLKKVDSIEDPSERMEFLLKGMLAGNVFDLGSVTTIEMYDKGELTFDASFLKLLPRPWCIDGVKEFVEAWRTKPWRKVVIFCDNAGADTILGVFPLAREFLKFGAQVVLAANDFPTINDITYQDLLAITSQIQTSLEDEHVALALDKGTLLIVNSGSDLPVIDLAGTSPELAFASDGAELVVLVGMGRGIETNLYAEFTCDSLNVGMIKHQEVADFLGGRLFDGVVKYTAVGPIQQPAPNKREPIALNF